MLPPRRELISKMVDAAGCAADLNLHFKFHKKTSAMKDPEINSKPYGFLLWLCDVLLIQASLVPREC